MTRSRSDRDRLLAFARTRPLFRAADVAEQGIHTQWLTRLVQQGVLERITRGQYRWTEAEVTENHGLILVATAVPKGVVCLLSALQFHGIGTQLPHQVWIALDPRTRKPALSYPPLRVVRFSGQALTAGLEHHRLEGGEVKIYGLAKTLADCWKYRHKIGLDVALEALRDAWQQQRLDLRELDRYARICRVQRVMQPYLEAIVA
jgi:predicted transcriptional regulator of viral defense system